MVNVRKKWADPFRPHWPWTTELPCRATNGCVPPYFIGSAQNYSPDQGLGTPINSNLVQGFRAISRFKGNLLQRIDGFNGNHRQTDQLLGGASMRADAWGPRRRVMDPGPVGLKFHWLGQWAEGSQHSIRLGELCIFRWGTRKK